MKQPFVVNSVIVRIQCFSYLSLLSDHSFQKMSAVHKRQSHLCSLVSGEMRQFVALCRYFVFPHHDGVFREVLDPEMP